MKDLLKLYGFESVHGTADEVAICDHLEKWFKDHGIKDVQRKGNNLYRFADTTYPILSAHMDQVRTNGKAVHFMKDTQGYIKAYNKDWEQTSLGADDKNGIWIILKVVEEMPKLVNNLNFVISCGEEVGCVGIKELDAAGILEKSIVPEQFAIVMDRRGNHDMLGSGSTGKYCATLAQDLCNYLGNDNYSVASGTLSDTSVLCKYCEAVNMSTAYEGAHTAKEHTDWKRLQEIKEDVKNVIEDFAHYATPPAVYNHKSQDKWYSHYYEAY